MNDRRLNAEKEYWINFTEHNKKFCLSLHYNGKNSYIFVNGADMHIIKGKDSEIKTTLVYLGSISKTFRLIVRKIMDFMDMFTILMLFMMLLLLIIY